MKSSAAGAGYIKNPHRACACIACRVM